MKSSQEKTDLAHVGLFFCVLFLLLTSPFIFTILRHPKADICAVDSSGLVMPNRSLEGSVQYLGRSAVIERGSGKEFRRIVIAGCGKSGCEKLYDVLQPLKGQFAVVDFCGKSVVSVSTAEGLHVYDSNPKTQAALDHEYIKGSITLAILWTIALLIIIRSIRVIRRPAQLPLTLDE